MAEWNNYELMLRSRIDLSKADKSGMSNNQATTVQKLAGQRGQSDKCAAPDVIEAFTQIFQGCDPKESTKLRDRVPDPSKPHANSNELRKHMIFETRSIEIRERSLSSLERIGPQQKQQDEKNLLVDDDPPSMARREDIENGSQAVELLSVDVTSSTPESIAPYWMPQLPMINEVAPAASSRDFEEFMALIERHVERLAVSMSSTTENAVNQVMISLTGSVFQQASLLLTRTLTGWSLKTMGISDENITRFKRHAPRLVERFAEGGLGELEFDVIDSASR